MRAYAKRAEARKPRPRSLLACQRPVKGGKSSEIRQLPPAFLAFRSAFLALVALFSQPQVLPP